MLNLKPLAFIGIGLSIGMGFANLGIRVFMLETLAESSTARIEVLEKKVTALKNVATLQHEAK